MASTAEKGRPILTQNHQKNGLDMTSHEATPDTASAKVPDVEAATAAGASQDAELEARLRRLEQLRN